MLRVFNFRTTSLNREFSYPVLLPKIPKSPILSRKRFLCYCFQKPPMPPSSSSTKIVADYAKSNRSSCKKCSKKIAAKDLRLGLASRDARGFDVTKWHHLDCFSFGSDSVASAEEIKGFDFLKLINRMESIQENSEMKGQIQAVGHLSPESALKSVIDNGASMRQSTHGCIGKEDIGKEISSNGFVTTRKGRYSCANDKNSPKVDQKENREGTVPFTVGKDPLVKRKALSETTNLLLSSGMEITGKWQCPQKKKPNLGPPLKQLRLERWVHRV